MTTNHANCTHPTTKAARAMCRRSTTRQENLAALIDSCFQDVLAANAAEPYSSAAYDLADTRFEAAVLLYTDDDFEYAEALLEAIRDSMENMHWYTTQWTRDQLVYHFHTYTDDTRDALELRLGVHYTQLED